MNPVKLYAKIIPAEVFTPEIVLEITSNVFIPNSVSVRCPVQQGLVVLLPSSTSNFNWHWMYRKYIQLSILVLDNSWIILSDNNYFCKNCFSKSISGLGSSSYCSTSPFYLNKTCIFRIVKWSLGLPPEVAQTISPTPKAGSIIILLFLLELSWCSPVILWRFPGGIFFNANVWKYLKLNKLFSMVYLLMNVLRFLAL